MGNLRAVATIAAIAFSAACGDDAATPDAPIVIADAAIDAPPDAYVPDAPNYDFSCVPNAVPTTATATVTIGGTAREIAGLSGPTLSSGAQITACRGDCMNGDLLDTQTTGSAGTFTSIAIQTGGTPVDGYLRATKANFRTTYVYPASPLTQNLPGVPVFILGDTVVAGLAQFGITQAPAKSIVGIAVTDCAQPPVPIPGAIVSVTQNGTAVGDAPFDVSTLDPQGEGAFIIFNVPPGANTVVHATYNGMTLREHTVNAVAGTTTMTQVKPGF